MNNDNKNYSKRKKKRKNWLKVYFKELVSSGGHGIKSTIDENDLSDGHE